MLGTVVSKVETYSLEAKVVKLKPAHKVGKFKQGTKRWEAKAGKLKHGTNSGKLMQGTVVLRCVKFLLKS